MVKKKTVDAWGFGDVIQYELGDDNDTVTSVFCSLCRDNYSTSKPSTGNIRGAVSGLIDKWITGSTNIKKSSAVDHVSKSVLHRKAVSDLGRKDKPISKDGESSTNGSRQSTMPEMASKISKSQKQQMVKKFQLMHFLARKCKPFSDYESIIHFEKNVHKVDVGGGYLNRNAASAMATFLARHIRNEDVTVPLNSGSRRYYSLFYDGSSSAKTMDEKEVYVIKTCKDGKPNFQVCSLEEPENTDAKGLKAALDNSISKLRFTFDRKYRQIGNGSDGAAVNKALFKLEQEDIGQHLVNGWCANHKAELGIHDAFKNSDLNTEVETLMGNIHHFFKKANLKWRLFKRQSLFLNNKCLRYKRVTGTRWTSHQVESSSNFLRNLETLIGFLNHQIAFPHNKTMKDAGPVMTGHLKPASNLTNVIYIAVRQDILAYLSPFSQALEGKRLLVPGAMTAMKSAIQVMTKLNQVLKDKGTAAFYRDDLFPTLASLVWLHLEDDTSGGSLPGCRTRTDTAQETELTSHSQTFHGYSLTVNLDSALEKVLREVTEIVDSLEANLQDRFADFLADPLYIAAAVILDAKSYKFKTCDEISHSVQVIVNRFRVVLEANNCDMKKLLLELTILFNHITTFLSASTNEQIWENMFQLNQEAELNISNILHIIEISIVLPVSSADVERVFSYFTKTLSKERISLSNASIETLLIIRSNDMDNYNSERYVAVVDDFLNLHPDGTARKRKAQPSGHRPHKRKKKCTTKANCLFMTEESHISYDRSGETADVCEEDDESDLDFVVEDIDLEEISDSRSESSDSDSVD